VVDGLGVDGFDAGVDGFVLGDEMELGTVDGELDELDAALLALDAASEVAADVALGAGVLGALVVEFAAVSAPAAACCTASVLFPPEPDAHPLTPIATTPAAATRMPPLPAPEVLMPIPTPEALTALRRGAHENLLVIEGVTRLTIAWLLPARLPGIGDRRTTRLPVE